MENQFMDKFIGILSEIKSILESMEKTPIDPSKVCLGISYFQLHRKEMMEDSITRFINETSKYWDDIQEKRTSYFIDNVDSLLPEQVKEHVESSDIKSIFENNMLSDDDMEQLWEYMHSLVRCGIQYIHAKREPYCDENGKKLYGVSAFENISGIIKTAKRWDVELKF